VYEPVTAAIPGDQRSKMELAEAFHEVLEHRWFLSEAAGRDVGNEAALASYLDSVLPNVVAEARLLPSADDEAPWSGDPGAWPRADPPAGRGARPGGGGRWSSRSGRRARRGGGGRRGRRPWPRSRVAWWRARVRPRRTRRPTRCTTSGSPRRPPPSRDASTPAGST
jgi:hypothetical protein